MLEDLCLSILSDPESPAVLDEIQRFLQVLKRDHARELRHEFKSKLHTYLSVDDAYVSLKIGEAANAHAFDWNSEKLAALKRFMTEAIKPR